MSSRKPGRSMPDDGSKDRERVINKLREKSRYEYLDKREEKKLKLLEDTVRDEKILFNQEELTRREKERTNFNEDILRLAKDRKNASDMLKVQQYRMPQDKPLDEDEINDREQQPGSEQRRWEEERLNIADMRFGARDRKLEEKNYEIIVDEELEFINMIRDPGFNIEEFRKDPNQIQREAKLAAKRSIQEVRRSLPVYLHREQLIKAVRENPVIIIQGETGCGKTTQIPQYLHEAGFTKYDQELGALKKIGCTQPRRVAAMSVAARVAKEMDTKLGHSVGYSIRFEDCTSEGTLIKYMTDGMLLREFLDNPTLENYSVMIIDEAHERTLHTDILFGLVKDIIKARDDFRLIISSATLDQEKFSSFFDGAPIFKIPGRRFPVDIYFANSIVADYLEACVSTIFQIHLTQPLGDILVFLPGQEEIENVEKAIQEKMRKLGSECQELIIRPIYANLPTDLQAKVFEPTPEGARKVVIATNIAETSLTIDGIIYVIDPGFCKQNNFDPNTHIESLKITAISKANADQRKGRAGRVAPGKCFRLYTKQQFEEEFEENPTPEIQRVNLSNVVLLLKTMFVKDILGFEYLDKPKRQSLILAIEQLFALQALDVEGELTLLGRKMAEFPLDPMMSKALIMSEKYDCSEEIMTIMSMLNVNGSIFFRPKDRALHADTARKSFFSPCGDHVTLLKVYDNWSDSSFSKQWCSENFVQYRSMCRARDVRDQLVSLMERAEIKIKSNKRDTTSIRKALLSGFFYNAAHSTRQIGSYRTYKKNQTVYIHPHSSLFEAQPECLMYNEILETTKEYLRTCCVIEPEWLPEVAPMYYTKEYMQSLKPKKLPKAKSGKTQDELTRRYE